MKRYIAVYRRLLIMNFSRLIIYRSNFVNNLISSTIWALFAFITIIVLTRETSHVAGWTREELMLLTGVYSIIVGLFHTFLTRNFERMSIIINKGQLDTILVSPIDAQFILTTRYMNFTSMIRVIAGLFFIGYILTVSSISVSLFHILGACVLLFVGMFLLYTIWFLVLISLIYNPQLSNLVDLMFTVSSFAKYPRSIFSVLPRELILIILPLTFIASTPVRFLLGKSSVEDFIGLFGFSIGLFVITRFLWIRSLRNYTSASS